MAHGAACDFATLRPSSVRHKESRIASAAKSAKIQTSDDGVQMVHKICKPGKQHLGLGACYTAQLGYSCALLYGSRSRDYYTAQNFFYGQKMHFRRRSTVVERGWKKFTPEILVNM